MDSSTEEMSAKNERPPSDVVVDIPLPSADEKLSAFSLAATRTPRIMATPELPEVISRCRKRVRDISTQCRRENRCFRDIEFDLAVDKDKCLNGLDFIYGHNPTDTMRVTEIFEHPQFYVNGAATSGIAQGVLGDCSFLSELAVIATIGLVEEICVERDEEVGIYGFIFWKNSQWVDVVVDEYDSLRSWHTAELTVTYLSLLYVRYLHWSELTKKQKKSHHYDEESYNKQFQHGGKALYFARSTIENETWVPLIEKAYAKLHGDYSALEAFPSGDAMEDLTGGVSTMMNTKDILDKNLFWTSELNNPDGKRALVCSLRGRLAPASEDRGGSSSKSPGSTQSLFLRAVRPLLHPFVKVWDVLAHRRDVTGNGLSTMHAYSVIGTAEYEGMKFVKLRNPWGKTDWKGKWSEKSKEWGKSGWPLAEVKRALGHKFEDNGEFVMTYDDFLRTWDYVSRCRFFDEEWILSQIWLSVPCGKFPKPVEFGDVTFTFSLSQASNVVVVLAQLDKQYFRGIDPFTSFGLEFVIYRRNETDALATSLPHSSWYRSVNVELNLDAGEYVVQVRIDRLATRNRDEPLPNNFRFDALRKYAYKQAEILKSSSIASNFDPLAYGSKMPVQSETFRGQDLTTMEIQMHQELKKRAAERHDAHPPPQSFRPNLHVETRDRSTHVDAETQCEPQVTPEPVQLEGSLDHREEEIPHVEDAPQYLSISLHYTPV
ncbi:cysteine proteinase [Stereum hirsutum FP-91666 SS1]|uniref:Cysteine proteinase n=1 Tax=Stereum hirsutum (strain FP-91666) TaxID=721885 RepID=R7S0W7_STEHR|nr:cysteine proteinase [Stereum hirsutum FP-91666 SS1]EIM80197.1 cysteine proteinase [Stereum hirsutum FP-91666 SS1]